MNLKQGKDGETFKVVSIHLEHGLERRLQALGLTEGSKITVVNNKKKGSMIANFRNTNFALGKYITENIVVEEL